MATKTVVMLAVLLCCTSAQYQEEQQPRRPLPAILMHKQALSQDGSFNYVFAADNGLQQGESISPDGTRNGAYSYVDPNGQRISVRYTAGKDGFRVLEGDHLPKAPQAQVAAPQAVPQIRYPQAAVPQVRYPAQGVPQVRYPAQGVPQVQAPVYRAVQQQPNPYYKVREDYTGAASAVAGQPNDQGVQEPHSFGPGYAFEFSG